MNESISNFTAKWEAFIATDNVTPTAGPLHNSSRFDTTLHVYLVIRALLGIIIMTFNGLLLFCIYHFQYLHTPTNTLVANLCIADFLGGCQQFFMIVTVLNTNRSSWSKLCLAGEIVNMVSTGGNMWSLFAISIDSCLFICKPLHYHSWVTIERILKLLVFNWIYIISSVCATLLKFNRLVTGMPCRTVIILDPLIYNSLYFPQFICLITGFVLCYSVIATVAWKQKKKDRRQIAPTEVSNPNAASVPDSTASAADWKIVKMMALIPGVYFLSMCPAAVFGFMNNRLARESLVHVDRAATILWWTQSWANPLIYAWKNEDFRRAIKAVLRIHPRAIHNDSEAGIQ